MCLAYPGTVKDIKNLQATVDYSTFSEPALIGEKKVKVGDKVLVQMGVIVKIISNHESKLISDVWKQNFYVK
jgi:hydrogenase maturation factor